MPCSRSDTRQLREDFRDAIARLATEVNESFQAQDAGVRVETPMSLRSTLDRLPTGLWMYAEADDSLLRAWEEFVLPHIDEYDRDHYETVWNAVVRKGPEGQTVRASVGSGAAHAGTGNPDLATT